MELFDWQLCIDLIQPSHQQKSLIKKESLSGFEYRRRDSNPHTIASTGF